MWDIPGSGMERVSPALQGGFLTGPPGKPPELQFKQFSGTEWSLSQIFFCHASVLSRYLAYLMFPTLFHQCGSISIMHQHHALWNRKTIKLSID